MYREAVMHETPYVNVYIIDRRLYEIEITDLKLMQLNLIRCAGSSCCPMGDIGG